MPNPKWSYYEPEQFVKEANLTVLCLTYSARTQEKTKYLVKYGCCGGEEELTHAQIRKRVRARYQRCKACGVERRTQILLENHSAKHAAGPVSYSGKDQERDEKASRDYPPMRIPQAFWPAPKVDLPAGWVPFSGTKCKVRGERQ